MWARGWVAFLAVLAALLLWLAVSAARRLLLHPLDMTRIRYVARFRYPLGYRVLVLPAIVAIVAVLLRLIVYVCQLVADRTIVGIDNFWMQWSIYALLAFVIVVVLIAALARIPRKPLCFDDGVVIKYLAYRSVRIPPEEVAEVGLRRFSEIWLTRRLWSCLPLTLGIVGPAIFLRRRNGRSYFFSVRDGNACLRALGRTL